MELIIKHATRDDLESLSQLYEELIGEQTNRFKMEENFELMEQNPNYIVFIAKEANLVVGSVMGVVCLDYAGKCNPFMVIENVVVKGSCRGRGIGLRLMEEIGTIGRNRNCYILCLFLVFIERKPINFTRHVDTI